MANQTVKFVFSKREFGGVALAILNVSYIQDKKSKLIHEIRPACMLIIFTRSA